VAGLEGQGSSDLVEAMAGVQRAVAGAVTVDGRTLQRGFRNYRAAFRAGVAYVPAKRQEEGLFGPLSVRDNMVVATINELGRFGFHRKSTLSRRVQHYMDLLAVWPNDQDKPISALSGGNAQKVLISRWLAAGPRVLILNDPLRGVDIGTKRQFYALLQELADDGVAVVLLSTEIEELLVTSHRIAVCRGATVSTVLPPEEQSYDAVLAAMFGISHRRAEEMTGGMAS
ncbi:MAG: ATP-binding cassette domain-containing protein, partial [Propionibacteriaceae bacterium]